MPESPTVIKLLSSPRVGEIWRLLEGKRVTGSLYRRSSPVGLVLNAVEMGIKGPDRFQRMTKGERTKLADKIQRATWTLGELLDPLLSDGVPSAFQINFDLAALEATDHYKEHLEGIGGGAGLLEDEDVFNACRFAIYHILMDGGIPYLLGAIQTSAEAWAEEEQFLAKPNDPNAERLFFIRVVSQTLYRAFGTPLRALTLELTAVFFDCQDIDEASLSRLAPASTLGFKKFDAAAFNEDK